jgi:hypothetical protein
MLCSSLKAQKLTFGAKIIFPFKTELETLSELNYFYADDINSSYKLVPENKLKTRSYVSLIIYTQYMLNDNWFISYYTGYLPYLKRYNIYYNTTYIDNINLKTRFDYSFFTNSLRLGYKFLRTKEVRPKIYAGVTYFSLFRFKEVLHRAEEYRLVNQYPYGQVIHQQIAAIKDNFFSYTIGLGLDYYLLNFDIVYDYSILDVGNDLFYKHYSSLYFTAGINLATLLVKSRKVIKYKFE